MAVGRAIDGEPGDDQDRHREGARDRKDDAIVAGHRQERPADRHPDGATEQLGGQVDTARLAVLRRRDGRHDRARPATRGSTACGFSPSSARSGE